MMRFLFLQLKFSPKQAVEDQCPTALGGDALGECRGDDVNGFELPCHGALVEDLLQCLVTFLGKQRSFVTEDHGFGVEQNDDTGKQDAQIT